MFGNRADLQDCIEKLFLATKTGSMKKLLCCHTGVEALRIMSWESKHFAEAKVLHGGSQTSGMQIFP